jgi:hypothetical protein
MDTTTDTTTTDTPTTTEPTASPSPAAASETSSPPAAPPAVATPSTRPKSFRDALVRADAQLKTETPAPPGAATIAPPDASPKPQEPPKETWPQILANARTKATAEAEAKFNQDFGWARAIPQQTIQEWSQIARRMSADPIGFLNEYVAELQRHPTHSIALRSEAGRILSGHANGEPTPDVQLVNEQGQVTGTTYSAEGLAKRDAWRDAQLLEKVQREFGPLKAEREQERQTQAITAQRQQLESKADAVMAELGDILDGQTALFAEVDRVMGEHPDWSAHKAALEVRKLKITPQQQSTAQAAAADTFRKKAAAQTADGRASASTPPKRLEGRKDIAEFLRRAEAQS